MKNQHRIIAFFMCICLLLGMVPGVAYAAVGAGSITLSRTEVAENWDSIKSQFENATKGQTVLVTVDGRVEIPEPLKNEQGATFYVEGINGGSLRPQIVDKDDVNSEKFKGTHLFTFTDGSANSKVVVQNLTLKDRGTGFLSCFPH